MRVTGAALCLAAAMSVLCVASAQVPQTMSYQGVLRDGSGNVVPDGSYQLTFRLYNVESEGTTLWSETQTLQVSGGILNAVLGSVTALSLAFDVPYWLGVSVGGGAELAPRTELTSAPYALRALHAEVAADDDWVISGDDIYRLTGRVGIGTDEPAERLHVAGDARVDSTLYVRRVSSAGGAKKPHEAETSVEQQATSAAAGRMGKGRAHQEAEPTDNVPVVPGATRSSDLELQTDGVTRVHVDGGTGNVGVGTVTPQARLDVAGVARVQGFAMPGGASDAYVLTAQDATGAAAWEPSSGDRVPEIRYADRFDGDTAGEKIAAAINNLPASGGIVDARGLAGGTIAQDLFHNVSKNVTLLLGAGTYSIDVPQSYDYQPSWADGSLRIIGQGRTTVLMPTTSMTVLSVNACQFLLTDVEFDLNSTNSTAVLLRGVGWVGATLERFRVKNGAGTAPLIKVGIYWGATGAPGAVLRDLFLIGPLTCNGIEIRAEGVLVDRCLVWGCHDQVHLYEGTACTVRNCLFWNGIHSFVVSGYNTATFSGNDCESQVSEGHVWVEGPVPEFPVIGVNVRDNYFTGLNNPAEKAIYLKNVTGVDITGNRFQSNFAGSGAKSIVFDGDVSDVHIAGNTTGGIEPDMPGVQDVPLAVDDATAAQSSGAGGFAAGLTVSGPTTIQDALIIEPAATPPSNPVQGQIYMDATSRKLMVFDGTSWKACW